MSEPKVTLQDILQAEVSKQLDARTVARMDERSDLNAIRKKEDLTRAEIYDAAKMTWLRNGMTCPIDAQDFVNDPDRRQEFKITFKDLCGFVQEKGKDVDDAEVGDGVTLEDNIGLPTNAGVLIPRIITQIVREAAEPIMVGQSLLRRISHTYGTEISFPAVGGFIAADLAPGQEYPEKSLEFAGQVTAKIGKSGIKIRVTEEMVRYSMFDVISLHMRAGARALTRHKETKIFNKINTEGTTAFDNTGASSLFGKTTGRDRNGAGNFTFTLDDLMTMYTALMNSGFTPDTIIMNPMGWLIFVLSGTLRSFGFVNGGRLWGTWNGQPGQSPRFPGYGASGGAPASATPAEMPNANLQGNVPTLFPAPLAIVVSPFVAFDSTKQTTTITMCDRSELGYYIEDEPLVTETWNDPSRDIQATKFRERYALAIDHQGDAITNAKGIKIAKGHDFEDFSVVRDWGTGEFPEITGTV